MQVCPHEFSHTAPARVGAYMQGPSSGAQILETWGDGKGYTKMQEGDWIPRLWILTRMAVTKRSVDMVLRDRHACDHVEQTLRQQRTVFG